MHDARETLGAAWSSDHGCIFAVGGFDGHLGLNSIEQLDSRTGTVFRLQYTCFL